MLSLYSGAILCISKFASIMAKLMLLLAEISLNCPLNSDFHITTGAYEVHGSHGSCLILCSEPHQETFSSSWYVNYLKQSKD